MHNNPIQTEIILNKNQELRGVEITLDNTRKVVVENIDQFEPLSKYIDADKLFDISNLKSIKVNQRIDNHTILVDLNKKAQDSAQQISQRPITQNQQGILNTYLDLKREKRIQVKQFQSRTYSAFTQKRKQ